MTIKLIDKAFFKLINISLNKMYKSNVEKFGFNPMGLHWSSKSSQRSRFQIIYNLMKKHIFCKEIKIADIGCGFGDFFEFLEEKKDLNYFYKGYDINPLMISYCKKKFNSKLFELSDEPKEICDYSIISGTYNYAIYDDIDLWERYLIFNLKKCLKKSSKGIIFNLQISSKSKIVNNIYYAGYDSIGKILNSNFNIKVSHIDKITPNDVYYVLLN